MNIIFLIIHYNNPTALQRTVENFMEVGISADNIVVYDNGSSKISKNMLNRIAETYTIKLIYGSCNDGWGKAINNFFSTKIWMSDDIVAISAHDALLRVYDPCVVEKEFSDSSTAILCPDYPSPEMCCYSIARGFRCSPKDLHCRSEVLVGHATLCFVRPMIINRIHYDENFFIYGCESEIFLRIYDFGYKTILTDQIIVENPSTDSGSEFRELAFTINSIYCARIRGGRVGYAIRLAVVFLSLIRLRNLLRLKLVRARIRGVIFSLRTGGAGFKEYPRQGG
jgi:GT2 family glycosyltransferase